MSLREEITEKNIDIALDKVREMLLYRMKQKGPLSYINSHETLGIITEEYWELVDAVKSNEGIESELIDIAVGCIFGIASIPYMEW